MNCLIQFHSKCHDYYTGELNSSTSHWYWIHRVIGSLIRLQITIHDYTPIVDHSDHKFFVLRNDQVIPIHIDILCGADLSPNVFEMAGLVLQHLLDWVSGQGLLVSKDYFTCIMSRKYVAIFRYWVMSISLPLISSFNVHRQSGDCLITVKLNNINLNFITYLDNWLFVQNIVFKNSKETY